VSEWTHESMRLLDPAGEWIAARAFVEADGVFARSW
jgi:hypothetical protein